MPFFSFRAGLFGPQTRPINRDDSRVIRRLEKQASNFEEVRMEPLPKVPSMISHSEQRYLYWLTSQGYSGQGAVVELGSFLGCSAMHLGAGLRNAGFTMPLWCFDKFEWSGSGGWSDDFGVKLANKANYRALFLANVRPVYPPVRAIKTEIKRIKWKRGLVEILFLDAPKRLPDISAALTQFAPHMEPHFSLLVCQDYSHAPSFELSVCLSQLSGKIELIHMVLDDSTTVSFMLRDRLTAAETTQGALSFRHWSVTEAKERWASILAPLHESARERLELGLALLLYDLGHVQEAIKLVDETKLSEAMLERWRDWARPFLYPRYAPVFDAIGVRPR